MFGNNYMAGQAPDSDSESRINILGIPSDDLFLYFIRHIIYFLLATSTWPGIGMVCFEDPSQYLW